MRYHIEKEMTTFGKQGDVIIEAPNFYYFPKEKTIKTIDHLVHNFKLKEEKLFKVSPGDVIECNDFKLTICDGNAIELEGDFDSTLLQTSTIETSYPDYPEYTNSPRIKKEANADKVDLERIPEKDKDTSTSSLVKKLLPALVGIVMAILMLWVRPRGIRGILMLITTLVSFGISMFTLYTERRDGRAHNKLRKETYDDYLLTKRQELAALKLEERTSSNYNYLTLNDILVELDSHSSRLYERDILDDDFLKLRLGTQTTEPSYSITNPFEKLELRYEEADDNLKALYEEYKQITNMPLVIDAKKNIGLVGNRYVISKQMKNILMQSIFNHSYLDLQIIVITDDTYLDDYQYAFSMAHFKDSEKVHNYFVHNSITRDQYLNGFTQVLRQRDMEYKQGMVFDKHLLFIIDNPALINNHPIREFLEKPEERLGMSQIQVAKSSNELPKHIKTTIDYKTETRAQLILEEGKLVNNEFILPSVDSDKAELELYYRRLSNLEHIKGIKSAVPDQLGFLEMYEVSNPKELQIASRWNKNKTYKSLAALLGKKSETDYIYLDLHEKIHGPHGLVAGTTGSGKSEVIQTYILSLAIEYSPEQVGFLLIDYKGGGMANLFKDMPHHLGSITNLDGYQSMRALASIKSELKRRQQIFSDNNVNHINNYTKLYEAGQVQEPLPHLFLISDEFAELKAEQPDFMKELVSAARIGRSLGIHLILATQKPDGVVDDQIWSNSKFKLSLKVAEEADSKALLKTPDAAYITNPGRGYLKVGTNELYELFQSGYSGAPYSTNNTTSAKPEIYELDIYGNQTIINPEECTTEQEQEGIAATELDVVLQEIDKTYKTSNLTQVSKPWLPPLENFMFVEQQVNAQATNNLEWTMGLVDMPDQQKQQEFKINLDQSSHALITGISGMGKTKAIANALLSMSRVLTPRDLKFYVLDFANGGLAQFQTLNHTADYILDYETDKLSRFLKLIQEEVVGRRALLKKEMVTDINLLDKSKYKVSKIVIVIDGYSKINELEVNLLDEFMKIIRDSASLGVHFIISATTYKEVKENLKQFISNRVILYANDKHEVNDSIGRTEYSMQEVPGRALVKVDKPEVIQMYYPVSSAETHEYSKLLLEEITRVNKSNEYQNEAIKEMPEIIEYKPVQSDGSFLYAGVSYEEITDLKMPFDNTLILGEPKRGKTNLLKILLEQSIHLFGSVLIIDSLKQELNNYKANSNVSYFGSIEEINNLNTDIEFDAIIINKLDLLEQIPAKELKQVYDTLGMQMLTGTKVFMEISENIGQGNRLFKQIRKATNIVVMQPLSSQRIVNVTDAKLRSMPLPEYSAFISIDRQLSTVKLPKIEIDGKESETVTTAPLIKKKTNNLMINGTPLKIQNMTICNSLGDYALIKALDAIEATDYQVVTNLDSKYTDSRDSINSITSYASYSTTDTTVLILDIKQLNEIERNVRLEFIDKLENNSNINFFIWLVSFGEGRVSNKYLKSIVKSRYALISGGFENNTLYQPSSVRNWSEELANSNLVLLNGNKLIKIKEGE
ncbi:type VII secretion protein EssC [Mollicutes bacterium LVI A0078]|nr:type VII secretion protein EssC [Mollicutes bacterium LVI A0075]WOO91742.1 type VII secretion protein EssC [Mollicutes bacterium LVI A0078]